MVVGEEVVRHILWCICWVVLLCGKVIWGIEGRKEGGREGVFINGRILLFSRLGLVAAGGGGGLHIFPPYPRLHRVKGFLFHPFTRKSEGKETETLLKMAQQMPPWGETVMGWGLVLEYRI